MSRKRNSASVRNPASSETAEKKRKLTAEIDDLLFRRIGAYAAMHNLTVSEVVQPALEAHLRGCFWTERATAPASPAADLTAPTAGNAGANPTVESVPMGETLNPFLGDSDAPDGGEGEGGESTEPSTSTAKRRRSAA